MHALKLRSVSVTLCLCLVNLLQCFAASAIDHSKPQTPNLDWEKARWIEKTAQILFAGHTLLPEEISKIVLLPKDEIVEQLLKDQRFGEAVLDFNLFYLGFRPPSLREYDGTLRKTLYHSDVYLYPAAINSANQVLQNGNYLKIFALQQPSYKSPLTKDADRRAKAMKDFHTVFAKIDRRLQTYVGNKGSLKEACQELNRLDFRGRLDDALQDFGIRKSLANHFSEWINQNVYKRCRKEQNIETTLTKIQHLKTGFVAMLQDAENHNDRDVGASSVSEIRKYSKNDYGLDFPDSSLTIGGFWRKLENSSTNFHRLRAQYILKTYFCDDLTPVSLPVEVGHTEGRHASEPACQACHFRLDPMAGFFRYHGKRGRDFTNRYFIYFDDEVSLSGEAYEQYLSSWKNKSAEREWNVGLIQSATNQSQNLYGTNLKDLFDIIENSEHAKTCLAKRMGEYFIGKNIGLENGWIKSLADTFDAFPKEKSGLAFKKIVKKMILSKSFQEDEPRQGVCYDRSETSNNSVPCAISQVIEKNCGSCHGEKNGYRNLNLLNWITTEKGSFFEHRDKEGNQYDIEYTRNLIIERISTDDPSRIMPTSGDMTIADRAAILNFLNQSE